MNAFAGFISLNNDGVLHEVIQTMAWGLVAWQPDETYYWGDAKARFVQFVRHNLPESVNAPQVPGFLHDMRLDESLGCHGEEAEPTWPFKISGLLRAARNDELPKLIGDYVFAHWDPESETLFAARDQMGQRLLYYVHQPGKFFVFASTISGLLALPEISRRPNIAKFQGQLNLESPYPEQSYYEGIYRLLPGHYLKFQRGNLDTRAFYDPQNIKQVRFKKDAEYREAFLDIFGRAVKARMRSLYPVGAHLSGGLDSSAVVAMAVCDGAPLTSFSAFPPKGYTGPSRPNWNLDDTRYVMAMKAKYPHIETVFVHSEDRDFFTGLDQTYAYLDGPCLNPCNRVWIDEISEQAAKKNIRTLLTGAMGNATISWKGYTFKQQLGWLLRAPRRYLAPSRWDVKDPRPLMLFQGVIRDTQAFYGAERAYWGVELRDPTHDQRLAEFCSGLPNEQFARGGVNRNLVRSAMHGLLPDEIRLRRDQGAQLGHWPRMLDFSIGQMRQEWPRIEDVLRTFHETNVTHLRKMLESWDKVDLSSDKSVLKYRIDFLRAFFVGRYYDWVLHGGRRANEERLVFARNCADTGCQAGY